MLHTRKILLTCVMGAACGLLMLSARMLSGSNYAAVRRLGGSANAMGIVHLGKCGGVSMENTIRSSLTPNAIQKRNPEYYHLNPPNVDKYGDWLALVRDPIERIQSSWVYEHPANSQYRVDKIGKFLYGLRPKFYECYPTLDEALIVGLTTPSKEEDDCPMVAKKVFSGTIDEHFYGMAHFQFNFGYYYTELLEKAATKNIYVVRTEHMVKDLNKVDHMLGGERDAFLKTQHFAHFNTTAIPMTNRTISPQAMGNLCQFLCGEIQLYKQLLNTSANLSPIQVYNETILPQLSVKCPGIAALGGECPKKPDLWGKSLVPGLEVQ